MESFYLLIILLIVLFACSAVFSCAETAIFSLSRVQLARLRDDSRRGARVLLDLLKEPRETLIGILLGNESVNNAIAVVAASAVAIFVTDSVTAAMISVGIVTPLVLIFGEMVPKNMAIGYASKLSPIVAIPLHGFMRVTRYLRIVLTKVADVGVRLVGADPAKVQSMILEDEFRSLVDIGERIGELSESERELIHGVFDLHDLTVEQVMTPSDDMFRVPLSWDFTKVLSEVRTVQFSRVPVYHDDPNDIVGLLYIRDLMSLRKRSDRGLGVELEEVVRPVLFVQPATKVEEMLRQFQRSKIHMALVTDSARDIIGLVTMHDVIETLVGAHDEEVQL